MLRSDSPIRIPDAQTGQSWLTVHGRAERGNQKKTNAAQPTGTANARNAPLTYLAVGGQRVLGGAKISGRRGLRECCGDYEHEQQHLARGQHRSNAARGTCTTARDPHLCLLRRSNEARRQPVGGSSILCQPGRSRMQCIHLQKEGRPVCVAGLAALGVWRWSIFARATLRSSRGCCACRAGCPSALH